MLIALKRAAAPPAAAAAAPPAVGGPAAAGAAAAPTPRPLRFAVATLGAGQSLSRWATSTTVNGSVITIDQVTDRVATDPGLRDIEGAFLLRVVFADGRVACISTDVILAAARDTSMARFLFFGICDDAVASTMAHRDLIRWTLTMTARAQDGYEPPTEIIMERALHQMAQQIDDQIEQLQIDDLAVALTASPDHEVFAQQSNRNKITLGQEFVFGNLAGHDDPHAQHLRLPFQRAVEAFLSIGAAGQQERVLWLSVPGCNARRLVFKAKIVEPKAEVNGAPNQGTLRHGFQQPSINFDPNVFFEVDASDGHELTIWPNHMGQNDRQWFTDRYDTKHEVYVDILRYLACRSSAIGDDLNMIFEGRGSGVTQRLLLLPNTTSRNRQGTITSQQVSLGRDLIFLRCYI